MSVNNLEQKVEQALRGYVEPLLGGISVYVSKDAEPGAGLNSDRVEVRCPSSRPGVDGLDATSGYAGRMVDCLIRVRTRADVLRDTDRTQIGNQQDRHDPTVGIIVDALQVSDLVAQLNAIGIAGIEFNQVNMCTTSEDKDNSGYWTDFNFDLLAYSVA
jgi:hypothetical protein